MNNAPSAAKMPAAGTQVLLSIRPGGQRLAAREVLTGPPQKLIALRYEADRD